MAPSNKPLILVTTDFTEISDYAIEHAAVMAKGVNGSLLILHVIDKYTKRLLKKAGKPLSHVDEKLQLIADGIQESHGIEVNTISRQGDLFHQIADTANQNGALLHFLGTRGKRGVQWLIGSFALKVVKRSPVPVVVIQKPLGNINYRRFIYPLDIDTGSKQKVKWAKTMHDAIGAHFDIFVDNYGDDYTNRKLRADLNQVTGILAQHNVSFTATFANTKGSFAAQLLAFAQEKNADAIMISSDPDKMTWNPFNMEDKVLYNKEKIPVMFINAKNLNLVIGGR
ncbi:MAG: universal stress protein [Bacteroidia bacterium]|nr:MAG: universal stress protein [Bacteroidia bacterium]